MADTDMTPAGTTPAGDAGPGTPESAGERLKQARETAGLGLAQISAATKIPTRMLVLIEAGDFAALPARTYATGFTRTYARALGLNAEELVDAVRAEMGMAGRVDPQQPVATFEPGDPARVPTARLAWLAALGATAVVVTGLFLWGAHYAPAVSLPSLLPAETISAEALPAPTATEAATFDAGLPTEAATTEAAAAPAFARPYPRRPKPVRRAEPRLGGILPDGVAPVTQPPVEAPAPPQPRPVSTGAN